MEEEETVFVYININMATETKGKAKEKISLDDEQKCELIALVGRRGRALQYRARQLPR